MDKIKLVLIDSIYINNSGGKVLLDYFIDIVINEGLANQFVFLLDPRGSYDNIDKINYIYGQNNERFRIKYYRNNKTKYRCVFCFGNVPPPIKLNLKVYTYFHNVLIAKSIKEYPTKIKISKFIKRLYIKLISKNSNVFLVQTEYVKQCFLNNISPKASVTLCPFFMLSKKSLNSSKQLRFLYVSNGNPHKNHNNLLKAWEILFDSEKYFNLELHLTVTNDYPVLINEIKNLQRKGIKIINHGYTDVNILYKSCSHMIYPSLMESFGLGLVEAVNAGLDVIASDLPFVKEVVKPTLVFDPLNSDSIAINVKKVLENNTNLKRSRIIVDNKIDELLKLLLSHNF